MTVKPVKKKFTGFTEEERGAMRERALELKAEARMNKNRAAGEKAILDKIASMSGTDKTISERLHAIITKNAPKLMPRTWYGMPAYANKDGKVVVFFRDAAKFKERYLTLGFNPEANLDEGNMWPVVFAVTKLTAAEEKQVAELVKKAVS